MERSIKTKLFLALGLILVVCVFLLANWLYLLTKFHIVSTNPALNKLPASTNSITINFNRTLTDKNLSVSADPSIVSQSQVQGKSLLISFNQPLNMGTKYTIFINYLSDASNESLSNKRLVFTPVYVPFNQLSNQQQQSALQAQTNNPPSKNNIAFSNFSDLLNYGITSAQLSGLEQEIFQFDSEAASAALVSGSIKLASHNPNSASTSSSATFNIRVDGRTYEAKIIFSNLTDIQLYLDDTSGKQVFKSG